MSFARDASLHLFPYQPGGMMNEKKSLFQIGIEGQEIEALLIEAEGELTPDMEKRFDELLAGGKEKLDAAAAVLRRLRASQEQCIAEAARLRLRAASFAANAERLEARMLFAVDNAYGGNLKTAKNTFWTQTAQGRLEITTAPDADLIAIHQQDPAIVKVNHAINTSEVRDRLKRGEPVPPGINVESFPGNRFLRVK